MSGKARSIQRIACGIAGLGFAANLVRLRPDLGFPIYVGCILLTLALLLASVIISAIEYKRRVSNRRGEALGENKGRIIIQDR